VIFETNSPPGLICDSTAMTFDHATARLLAIARNNDGFLSAEQVENDPELSAAAHALAGSTNVFGRPQDETGWFPYAELRFSELVRA
jgi:hypothetical protein